MTTHPEYWDNASEFDTEESRRLIRQVLGALTVLVPVGIVAVDRQGRSWYHSQRWEDATGSTGLSWRGIPWYLAVHPEDVDQVRLQWEERVPGRGTIDPFRVRSAAGVVRRCVAEAVAMVATDGTIGGYLVVVRDARGEGVQGLASGHLLERLLDRSEDIITILNPDGSWRWSNAGALRLIGHQAEFDPAKGPFPLVHPDEAAAARASFDRIVAEGGRSPERLHYRVRGADGSWHHMETIVDVLVDDPEVQGVVLQSRDMTAWRQTLQELEASNRRLANLIASMSTAVVLEDENGQVLLANQAFVELFRLSMSPQELEGQSLASLGLNPEGLVADPPDIRAQVESLVAARRSVTGYRMGLFDGRILEGDYVPMFVQGAYRGHLWIFRDVTDQVRVEVERERLLASEREENRRIAELEARRSEYLASVSHELRTPLTSIVGYAEMLRELLAERGAQEELDYVDVIVRNVDRIFRLSGDLLLLESLESRLSKLELEDIDVMALASKVKESIATEAERRSVTVEMHIEPGPPLRGDPGRLAQLLEILLSNAVKFSQHQGQVVVRVLPADDGGWALEVTDHGIGIPEDEQPLVFSRFYRGSNVRLRGIPGTGLGLPIARAVVDLHAGEISFRSAVGSGTTFTVRLPDQVGS